MNQWVAGGQQLLPTLGGRTREHSWSENPKWAADRRGKGGCCADKMLGLGMDWEVQREKENGKASLREKHICHSRPDKGNFFI